MYKKIALIAPYDGLIKIANRVASEQNAELLSYSGDLSTGLENARRAVSQGREVLVSRGGTASVIRDNLDSPVVEIQVSGFDLLRTLYPFKDSKKRLAVIGYDNVVQGAKTVADIIGIDIQLHTIAVEEDIIQFIDDAKNHQIDLIVGDTLAVRHARTQGMEYALIQSGQEAVQLALDQAEKMVEAIAVEQAKKKQLETILNISGEGILAVDKDGKVILYNPAAEKIIGIPRDQVMRKPAVKVIPGTRVNHVLKSGKAEVGQLSNTNNATIIANRIPLIIAGQVLGVVANFQDVTKIQELEQKIRQSLSVKGLTAKHCFSDLLTQNSAMQQTIYMAQQYARTDSTILLHGESGTGKELFAQAIHRESLRREGPFVAINCAALPGTLLESELFGYVEGAFTGARKSGKKGLFELAHKGTIFLDEISEMALEIQARILRVLQEKEVMRMGDDKIIPVDVRVIAATNKPLRKQVREGRFREDLFFRINVLDIDIPPLRDRLDDLPLLIESMRTKYNQKHQRRLGEIDHRVMEKLSSYHWPGNIRELENLVEKLVVLSDENGDSGIDPVKLGLVLHELVKKEDTEVQESRLLEGTLAQLEKKIILQVLQEEGYHKTNTAKRLDITRTTLNKKLGETFEND